MTSLYSRLYRNRQRPNRSSLENFLTEALADLLNRGGTELTCDFIRSCVRPKQTFTADHCAQLCASVTAAGLVWWKTQVPVAWDGAYGIADLALCLDEVPRMVIENKIWAPISRRDDIQVLEGGQGILAANQLHLYGRWLAQQVPNDPTCALVLLTAYFGHPDDFLNPGCPEYGVERRSISRWQDIVRWLRSLAVQPTERTCVANLAGELADFLGEENIRDTIMTPTDLAAGQLFIHSRMSFHNLYDTLREEAKATVIAYLQGYQNPGKRQPISIGREDPTLSDWLYLSNPILPAGSNWHVMWGLLLARGDDWVNNAVAQIQPVPAIPAVFVALAHEDHPGAAIDFANNAVPVNWHFNQADNVLIACRAASEFFGGIVAFDVAVAN